MVRALRYLIEIYYILRRDTHDSSSLEILSTLLTQFQSAREAFVEKGVRKENDIPPRQHSLIHYPNLIRDFGAPNGLCSSITESKHIRAVKEPWRRSNRYNALGQMLLTNQRLDKLSLSESHFRSKGMLEGDLNQNGHISSTHPSTPRTQTRPDGGFDRAANSGQRSQAQIPITLTKKASGMH